MRFVPCILLLACFLIGGCTSIEALRDNGLYDADAGWGTGYRETDPTTRSTGVTSRARQIERNLGIE